MSVGSGCKQSSSDAAHSSSGRSVAVTSDPAGRRQVAKQLQNTFKDYSDVSIYTKGDEDEILYIGFAGFSRSDKFKADELVDRFRTKIKGYGFQKIEFGDGARAYWNYPLDE